MQNESRRRREGVSAFNFSQTLSITSRRITKVAAVAAGASANGGKGGKRRNLKIGKGCYWRRDKLRWCFHFF